jgi:RNA polymerase sigma-70 factor, ECF subfamily
VQSPEGDPARLLELNESLSTAFLVMLESLSPLDRAVFLLHDVFGYTFNEVAAIVDRTPADCRQIGHRARERVRQGRPRFEVETETVEKSVQQFLSACIGGDMSELLSLLSPDVVVSNDTGGKVSAIRNTMAGADTVARLFLGIFRKWSPPLIFQIVTINGQPALVACLDGKPMSVTTFDFHDNQIHAIYQVFNPDKLTGLVCGGDMRDDSTQDERKTGE